MKKFGLIFVLTVFAVFACAFLPAAAAEKIDTKNEYILPIVMYHSTHRKNLGKYTVSPAQLERDLIWVKENGYTTVTVSELVAFQEYGMPLPEKPIMFTFDDGYQNNYINAFPLFKKYGMKCVMSVVGTLTDNNYRENVSADICAHLNYEQIKEMADSGFVEIQNHTYNFHKMNRRYGLKKMKGENSELYKELIKTDLLKIHDKIHDKTGITMNAVAFPFGGYSTETIEILREIGYKAAFTCTEGINKITRESNLFVLRRYNRPSGLSSAQFFNKILVKNHR